MSEERPQHTQEPAEGDEEDVGASGAERAGSNKGPAGNAGDEEQSSMRPQEPAEGGDEDVEAPGADRAGE